MVLRPVSEHAVPPPGYAQSHSNELPPLREVMSQCLGGDDAHRHLDHSHPTPVHPPYTAGGYGSAHMRAPLASPTAPSVPPGRPASQSRRASDSAHRVSGINVRIPDPARDVVSSSSSGSGRLPSPYARSMSANRSVQLGPPFDADSHHSRPSLPPIFPPDHMVPPHPAATRHAGAPEPLPYDPRASYGPVLGDAPRPLSREGPTSPYSAYGPTPYRTDIYPYAGNSDYADSHSSLCYGSANGSQLDARPRKRRGNLPKPVTDLLKSWFRAHQSHPYPSEEEKQVLMCQTGLTITQLSNWFINARRRELPEMDRQAKASAMTQQGAGTESDDS